MVNFHDPITILLDSFAFVKLSHTLDGLYIWEFLATLDYEWRVVRGRLPYRWTIWIYSLTRLATLMVVVVNITVLNITAQIDCQVLTTICFAIAFCTYALSSLLIILRVIAIWNWNKGIVGLATVVWVANVSLLVYGSARIRSSWSPGNSGCSLPNTQSNTATFTSMFITDFILLVIMLFGLLRFRLRGTGSFRLGSLLWKQGVMWLLLATLAELTPVVFLTLNLNEAFDDMFLMPSLITMSIAATRMYRSLADFCSVDVVDSESDKPSRIGPTFPNSKSTFTVCTPPRRVEVVMDTTRERYPSSLREYLAKNRSGPLQRDEAVSFGEDVESGI